MPGTAFAKGDLQATTARLAITGPGLAAPIVLTWRGSCFMLAQFACSHWRPRFIDYLFVAFTQSSTFGPTDAPLLARWAKVLAMIQVFISLSIIILLISRAVGVL